jgi:hypothetical protein
MKLAAMMPDDIVRIKQEGPRLRGVRAAKPQRQTRDRADPARHHLHDRLRPRGGLPLGQARPAAAAPAGLQVSASGGLTRTKESENGQRDHPPTWPHPRGHEVVPALQRLRLLAQGGVGALHALRRQRARLGRPRAGPSRAATASPRQGAREPLRAWPVSARGWLLRIGGRASTAEARGRTDRRVESAAKARVEEPAP